MTLIDRIEPHIRDLGPYEPGKPVEDPARHPFNVNRLAEAAALAGLEDAERAKRINGEGSEYPTRGLTEVGIEVGSTDANFMLAYAGSDTCQHPLDEGMIVRPVKGFGMPEHIRIRFGLREEPEENERLVNTLKKPREAKS